MIYKPPTGLTIEAITIGAIILACIVGLETAIILALSEEFGSFRKLIRFALGMASKRHKDTTNKSDITTKQIEK